MIIDIHTYVLLSYDMKLFQSEIQNCDQILCTQSLHIFLTYQYCLARNFQCNVNFRKSHDPFKNLNSKIMQWCFICWHRIWFFKITAFEMHK